MSRTPGQHHRTAEACYRVLNRGHNREIIFADDGDRHHFLKLLGRYRDRFALRIYHYCLISNHFHVPLQLDQPQRLTALIAGLLRSYVHNDHRANDEGSLFEEPEDEE